jgi:hypothetical protein
MIDLRAFSGETDLYFIRHGESEGNRDGLHVANGEQDGAERAHYAAWLLINSPIR